MQRRQELVIRFDVRDDLTSERSGQYRELVIRALKEYGCSHDASQDDHEMIDRMLNDHQDGVAAEVVELRRSIRRCLNDCLQMQDSEGASFMTAAPYEELDAAMTAFIEN